MTFPTFPVSLGAFRIYTPRCGLNPWEIRNGEWEILY